MNDDEKEQLKEDLKDAIESVLNGVGFVPPPMDCSAYLRLDVRSEGSPRANPLMIDIYDANDEKEPFYSVTVGDVLETMFISRSDSTSQLVPDEAEFKSFRLIRDELRRLADCIDAAMEPRDPEGKTWQTNPTP